LCLLCRRASPPGPLSIFDGEGEEVWADELLRLLAARYGATVVHLHRIFLIFPFPYVIVYTNGEGVTPLCS